VATQIPSTLEKTARGRAVKDLFRRFFALVLECSPGVKSIEFVFDRKPEIEKCAPGCFVIGWMRPGSNRRNSPMRLRVPSSLLSAGV